MESIWKETVNSIQFKELRGDAKTDVLIVGGGITGILCAYMLEKAGVDYILTEQNRICHGITQNTTAKITFQHGLIFDKIIKRFGVEAARLFVESQSEALERFADICSEIPCDFERCDSAVFTLADREKIVREVSALNELGVPAILANELDLPFLIAGAAKIENQAQFNPLKFLYGCAKDLNIYENTKIGEIRDGVAYSKTGGIRAKKIIIATHFPFINKYGGYFLKMHQQRSYVIAYENAPNIKGMYIDESKNGFSFRNYKDLLLVGGGGHKTGKKGGNWQAISSFAQNNFPDLKEKCRFATQDCMSLDGVAYIGKYSKSTPNIYVATGFNKWGMTNAMTAASMLCDLVLGNKNKYEKLYSPSRRMYLPQLVRNGAESVINLLTPTAPRCPHLGCALKYNKAEHSWDCPCHGSRFSENGELLDNPATDNKKM